MQAVVLATSLLLLMSLSDGRSVLLLSDENFESSLANHELVLVNFFSSHQCPDCETLENDFEQSAAVLKIYDPPVLLAAIDCGEDGLLTCTKHQISTFPKLQVFKRGTKAFDYEGPLDADGMTKHVKSRVTPLSKELESVEEVEQFLDHLEYSIIGFFEKKDSVIFERYEMFASTLSTYYRFGHTFSEEVLEHYSYKNTFLIFRPTWMHSKLEPERIEYIGKYIPHVMRDWVKNNIQGLVGYRALSNAVHFRTPLIVTYYRIDANMNTKQNSYWRNRVLKVADKFAKSRSNVSFAVSNSADFAHELREFGLTVSTPEKPVVIGRDLYNHSFVMTEEFSVDQLEKFALELLSEKLKPTLAVDNTEEQDLPRQPQQPVEQQSDSRPDSPSSHDTLDSHTKTEL